MWKKLKMRRLRQQQILLEAKFFTFFWALAEPFDNAESRVRDGRRFFVSRNGKITWVPIRTEAGGRVCVFQGMRIPVIMGPRGDRWEFIGACYIHRRMDGEIWDLGDLWWGFMSFV